MSFSDLRRFRRPFLSAASVAVIGAFWASIAAAQGDGTTAALEANLLVNPVVRQAQTGEPVTLTREATIRMAEKIAAQRHATGEDAGDRARQQAARARLEAKKRAAEKAAAAGRPIVTQTFILPGMTPEASRSVHDSKTGVRYERGENGKLTKRYVVRAALLPDNPQQACAVGTDCRRPTNAAEVRPQAEVNPGVPVFAPVTVTRKAVPRNNGENTTTENSATFLENVRPDAPDDAAESEALYRRYFPDAAFSPEKRRSEILRELLGLFVPAANANLYVGELQERPDSPRASFTQADLAAIRNAADKLKAAGRTEAEHLLRKSRTDAVSQKIAPAQFLPPAGVKPGADAVLRQAETVKPLIMPAPSAAKTSSQADERNRRTESRRAAGETNETPVTFVFISRSLGAAAIERIIVMNADRDDVTLVLRGVMPGENLGEAVAGIEAMVERMEETSGRSVNIVIDPTLFTRFQITSVPAVVRALAGYRTGGKPDYQETARVAGLGSDTWLNEQVDVGRTGDLGVQGTVYPVAEPDLIEELKRRAAAIDWSTKKREALAGYWGRQTFTDFPRATKDAVFTVDPTVLVTEDIPDADGGILHKAGDRINPLQLRPFHKTVVIFDATDPEQLDRVLTWEKAADAAGDVSKSRIRIAARFDAEKGWDGYQAVTDRFNAPVYQLTQGIAERFQVKHLPSVITADNTRHVFLVKELGPVREKKAAEINQGLKRAVLPAKGDEP